MELHPILETDVTPSHSLWYVASAFGDRPSLRVGHTSAPISDNGKIMIMVGVSFCFTFFEIAILLHKAKNARGLAAF